MADLRQIEERLQARREELMRRLNQIEHDLDQPMDADVEERATERESDEVLESLGQAGLQELRSIEAALQRISDKSYGFCASCGKAISDERLEAVPTTPFCRQCAKKQ